jgi:hypothetical protein
MRARAHAREYGTPLNIHKKYKTEKEKNHARPVAGQIQVHVCA